MLNNDLTNVDTLRDTFAAARRRWRSATLLDALAHGCLLAAGILALGFVIEWWVRPVDLPLVFLVGVSIVGAVASLVWRLWPVRQSPADRQIARLVEERCPELEDRLASAAELVDQQGGGVFRDLVIAQGAREARTLDLERIVSRSALRRAGLLTLVGAACFLGALTLTGPPMGRAVETLGLYLFPDSVRISVTPGNVKLLAGEPLQITAKVETGSRAATATLAVKSDDTWRTLPMQRAGDVFRVNFESISSGFAYRVHAGNATSTEYTVTTLQMPRIARIDVEYSYPSYTGLKPRLEEDGGDIYAPSGTTVRLHVHTSKPVTAGAMVMVNGTRVALNAASQVLLETGFELTEDGSYRVALSDADGLTNPGETEYFIRTMDDRPPDVRIVRPASDKKVTPLEEVPIEARAEDDYGLDRFELVYSVRGRAEKVLPLVEPVRGTSIYATRMFYVEDLHVQPGDFVTYYARARDIGRGKRSVEARSDIFFLEIKPFGEEFIAAQSQTEEGAQDETHLDALIAAQKEIIIATWKLDRRAEAGRSPADAKALAQAQTELKTRAEDSTNPRGSSAWPMPSRPQDLDPNTDPNPVRRAAYSMGKAAAMLEAVKTAEALPHEMEALNQLLRSQAESIRKQVAQQQSAGSGGSGRSGQDLSTLFDRELQRDSETNYENRSTAKDDKSEGETEAFEKLGELASRQDELNQAQKDLAREKATMKPEEVKRELEKLTMEQSELRREVEELSREMARDGKQSGGEKNSAGGGKAMGEVSQDMQTAASELRREDLGEASASGDRALEKLRNLQKHMAAQKPAGQQQMAAELQLEAQQMADAQKRLAEEARRLQQKGSVAGTEGEERLAAEQDALARRAEQLEKEVKELARSQPGTGKGQSIQQSAKTLEQNQVSRRMRQLAEAIRKQPGGLSSPGGRAMVDAEQKLANDLSQVAEQLGDAAGDSEDGTGQLSGQLADAKTMRERLAELERRIDELARENGAEGSQQGSGERQGEKPGDTKSQSQSGDPKNGQQSKQGEGERSNAQSKEEGSKGDGGQGNSDAAEELSRLRTEYDRELKAAQNMLQKFSGETPGAGGTPTEHQFSISSLGTEEFKQDFRQWNELKRSINFALERYEASLSEELLEREMRDRLKAGGDETMPDEYRKLVAKYYQSLAKRKP